MTNQPIIAKAGSDKESECIDDEIHDFIPPIFDCKFVWKYQFKEFPAYTENNEYLPICEKKSACGRPD
ncbi:MAG: hypothetical protein CL926_00505 [Deltaproteobacteria bacterium]|nr:hypothetical protein [Deltaproteobacteria bacterium]